MGKKINNNKKGIIIALDGGSGSGKSSISKLLYYDLLSGGYPVELLGEPWGSKIDDAIRDTSISSNPKANGISRLTSFFLFMGSRAKLINERADKALNDNKILIYDRYEDSTRVYQGILNKIGLRTVDEVTKNFFGKYKPNITILLDVDASVSMARANKDSIDSNSYDKLPLDYHIKVNKAFKDIFSARKKFDKYCHIIDSNREIKDVYEDVLSIIKKDLYNLYEN